MSSLRLEFVMATRGDFAPVARLAYANGVSRKRAFSAIGRNSMILAVYEAVLGFAMFRVDPDEYELEAVVVAEPVRRCGIASMLLDYVYDLAGQDGCVAIRATPIDETSVRLLHTNNYQPTSYGHMLRKVPLNV